jgi:hypothetical protein
MSRCSIVDEPTIEEGAVVVRVIVTDPAVENTGRVFVCRMTGFDAMTVEAFPRATTAHEGGEYRADAAAFAKQHAEANLDRFEELFEELARRRATESGEPG